MSDLLVGLNEAQRRAVTHHGSPLLVLAGAGSGKTRVLTHRAAWLVLEKGSRPDEILLLTFTNKAAEEMRTRLTALLHSATGTFRNSNVFAGTFHSFCVRILRRHSTALGIPTHFNIFDQDDQKNLVKKAIKDLGLDGEKITPSGVLSAISSAKNEGYSALSYPDVARGYWQETIAKIFVHYEKGLSEAHALDFDDLLLRTLELFQTHPDILARLQNTYRHILVDEYQDTNKVQYLITKHLVSTNSQLSAVGDASQAIYGWRGADYRNLLSLQDDYPNLTVINLEENYRSTQTILSAANTVIAKNTTHPVLSLFTNKAKGEKIVLFEADSEVDEANFLAEEIQHLHRSGIPYQEIAVLYRTNAQSRPIEEAFLRSSVPYVLIGGTRFYDRTEVKDVVSLLRLCLVPGDPVSWQRAQKTLGKRRAGKLADYLSTITLTDKTSDELMREVLSASDYLHKYDPKKEEDQGRLENIKELTSVAKSFPNLVEFLENIMLVQFEYSEQEKQKRGGEGVRLMTIHSAKGLEFRVVLLVGLEEGILPHSRSLFEAGELEEERRLTYVALTRAREKLYLTKTERRLIFGRRSWTEASRFLADIPGNLIERSERARGPRFQSSGYSSKGHYPNSFGIQKPQSTSETARGFSLDDPDLKRLFSDYTYDPNID